MKKLNEVKGMRGLGRYFKQVRTIIKPPSFIGHFCPKASSLTFISLFLPKVAQSTRSSDGGQDDYLGGVDIPVRDLPPTGLDRWYKLEGKYIFGHFFKVNFCHMRRVFLVRQLCKRQLFCQIFNC